MRLSWKVVPALVLAAAAVLPAAPASAQWHCSYFKWDSASQSWQWVQLLAPEDSYEAGSEPWDCKYCYVPFVPPNPIYPGSLGGLPAPESALQPVRDAAAAAEDVLEGATGQGVPDPEATTPLDGPKCPPVPPVWGAVDDTLSGG